MRLFLLLLLCVSGAVAPWSQLRAHAVWIEPIEQDLVVRFAEPDGTFEKSPGHLDSLSLPLGLTLTGTNPTPATVEKRADHFLLKSVSPTGIACVETSFTVRGGRKPMFYARWQGSVATADGPLLTLDIVPTGRPGQARVFLRGQPLGGVGATLRAPDGSEVVLTADGEGYLRFQENLSGRYLLTIAHHREPVAGFHLGKFFSQTSHNAALTWNHR